MGHRGLSHDRAPDEQLVVARLSGLCGWAHLASCSRPPFSSITNRTNVGCEWRRARRYLPFNSNTSRSIGSDQREKNPINDLFDVLRRQRLLQYHELIAHEVERQRSQAGRQLLSSDFAASNPAGQNFPHDLGVAFMHFGKERRIALVEKLCNQAKDYFWTYFVHHCCNPMQDDHDVAAD